MFTFLRSGLAATVIVAGLATPSVSQTLEDIFEGSVFTVEEPYTPEELVQGQSFNEYLERPEGYYSRYGERELTPEEYERMRVREEQYSRIELGLVGGLIGATYQFESVGETDTPTQETYPRFFQWDPTGQPADVIAAHIAWDKYQLQRGNALTGTIDYVEDDYRHGLVYLVNEESWADAVAAMAMENWIVGDAILLNNADVLSPVNRSFLEKMKTANGSYPNIVLVGGEQVLSSQLADELRSLGVKVNRYSGESRVETMLTVAERLKQWNRDERIYQPLEPENNRSVTLSRGYAHAGEGGSAAYADVIGGKIGPLSLLTTSHHVHPAVFDFLKNRTNYGTCDEIYVTLNGGPVAISPDVEHELTSNGCGPVTIRRATGASRYETNVAAFAGSPFRYDRNGFLSGFAYTNSLAIVDGSHDEMWKAAVPVRASHTDGSPVLYINEGMLADVTKQALTSFGKPNDIAAGRTRTVMCYASPKACNEVLSIMKQSKVPRSDLTITHVEDPARPVS